MEWLMLKEIAMASAEPKLAPCQPTCFTWIVFMLRSCGFAPLPGLVSDRDPDGRVVGRSEGNRIIP